MIVLRFHRSNRTATFLTASIQRLGRKYASTSAGINDAKTCSWASRKPYVTCTKQAAEGSSFVTSKNEPGDFDACWDPTAVNFDTLEPTLLEFDDARAAQKPRYGGELFPADWDALGNSTTFLEFFKSIRGGGKKGIVRIDLMTLT